MSDKKNSDAKIRANNKYTKGHYDRINLALPKGSRELIEYCAGLHGDSVNRYVCRIVLEAVRKELDAQKRSEQAADAEFYNLF